MGIYTIILILYNEKLYNINYTLNYGIITENMFPKDIIDVFIARYKLTLFCKF